MKRKGLIIFDIFMTVVILLGMLFSAHISNNEFNIQTSSLRSENVDKKFDFVVAPDNQKKKAGETAEINLRIENIDMGEVGLNNVVGYLSYDDSLFDEVNITAMQDWHFERNEDKSHEMYGKFLLYTMQEGVTEGQDVATITLKLKADVAPQTTEVTFTGLNSSDGEVLVNAEDKTAVIEIYNDSENPVTPDEPEEPETPVKPEQKEETPEEPAVANEPKQEVVEEHPTYSTKTGDNIVALISMLAIATVALNVMIASKKSSTRQGKVGIVSAISVIAIGLVALAVTSFAHNEEITTLINSLNFQEKWLNSETYLVTDETVSRIAPLTNVTSITNKFNKEIDIYKKDSNESVTSGLVATGMRISDGEGNYEAVVLGDINGDGESNTIELTNIIRNIVDSDKYRFSKVEQLAGDMNVDNIVDMGDVDASVGYILYGELAIPGFNQVAVPKIEVVEGTFNQAIDAYENKVTVKVTAQDGNATQTKYKIEGTSTKQYTVIESGDTFEFENNGVYKVSAYSYGALGNRSAIPYQIIVKKNPNNDYKVRTRVENVDGTYSETTEVKNGKIGSTVTAGENVPDGYEINAGESTLTGTVAEDEVIELVVTLDRKSYTLTLNAGDYISSVKIGDESNNNTISKTFKFGKAVNISAEVEDMAGYTTTFERWASADSTVMSDIGDRATQIEMPMSNVTLTAIAGRINNSAPTYTIEYYYQKDGIYSTTPDDSKTRNGDAGSNANVNDADKTPTQAGYVLDSDMNEKWSGSVAEDGSTVLKVYFKQEFAVTYSKGTHGTFDTQTTEHIAWGTDTPAFAGELTHEDGYVFNGWSETPADKVTATVEYVATWKEEEYDITYVLNGGQLAEGEANPTTYKISTEEFTLNNPTREGYTFKGWTGTGLNAESKNVTVEQGNTGDRAYEAQWEVINYNITYELNGGTLGVDGEGNTVTNPATYNIETPTFILSNPSKTGYTFLGWTGTGIDNIENPDETVPQTTVTVAQGSTGARAYEAKWRANTGVEYNVRYYLENLDSTDSSNKDNYTLKTEETKSGVTNEEVTAEIKTFAGFTYGENNANNKITGNVAGDGSLVLKVYYTRNSYTLTLSKDDNTESVTGAGTYKFEAPVEVQAIPKIETGYTIEFTKWKSSTADSEGADQLDDMFVNPASFTMPAGDVTLTAMASKEAETVNYTVETYYEVEGEYPEQTSEENKEIRQAETGATVNVTANDKTTTKLTYVLDSTKNGDWSGTVAGDGSTVLKVYFKQEFTVTYKPGAHGTFDVQTTEHLRYNADMPAFVGELTHEDGYVFNGWSVTPADKVTATVEYVATWKEEEYDITYVLNGGQLAEGETNPTTYTISSESFTIKNPSRNGYTFKGWTGTGLNAQSTSVIVTKGSTGDRAYEAQWEVINYNITYKLNGGTLGVDGEGNTITNPTTYNVETPTFALNNPSKAGYTFLGWTGTGIDNTENPDETVPQTTVTVVQGSTGARAYEAKWRANGGISYHVKHYIELLSSTDSNNKNNYELKDDIEFSGETNAPVTAEPQEYTGFTYDSTNPNNVLEGNISADGNLALELYYKRNSYTVTLDKDENVDTVTGAGTYKFEAPVQIDATLKTEAGYDITFVKWESSTANSEGADKLTDKTDKSASFTMPAGDVTLTATSRKDAQSVGYTVEYYYQADGIYKNTADSSVTRNALTGSTANVTADDKTTTVPTYVLDDAKNGNWSGTVAGDGSTVLKVYFKQEFTVTYSKGTHGTFDTQTTEHIAWGTDTPAFIGELTHEDGYVFNGWSVTPADKVTATVEYVATWKEEEYDITYVLNGGQLAEGEANPITYKISTEEFTLNNPTREGYIFKGWTGTGLNAESKNVTVEQGSTGDRAYEAQWEVINYSITYELNGGTLGVDGEGNTVTNPATYNIETPTFILSNPSKTGYTFLGWTGTGIDNIENPDETVPQTTVTVAQGSTGARAYEAKWRANTGVEYKVRYYLENLDSTDSSNKDNYILKTEETKSGVTNEEVTAEIKTFAGFTYDENNANNKITGNVAGDGSLVLKVYYTRNSYTLTLSKDDNTESVTGAGTYKFEAPVEVQATPKTEAGYTIEFTKWKSSTADSENSDHLDDMFVNPASFTMPAGDVTLTAMASKEAETVNYTVETYYEVEGEYPEQTSEENKEIRQAVTGATVNVTADDKMTTKPTYVLDETKNGDWSGTVAGDGSTVLKVYFKQEFTVTYKPGTHGTFDVQTTEHLRYNADMPAFVGDKTHNDGYEFTGWDKTVENKVTETVEYVAQWNAITYNIDYDLQGGSLGVDETTTEPITNPITYTVETASFTLNNPTKEGYTFKGWTGTDINNEEHPEQTVPRETVTVAQGSTGDRSYTAVWEAIEYNITYNLNDGQLAEGQSNPEKYTIETSTFTLNNPSKTGYTFKGWTGTGINNEEHPELTVPQETVTIAQGSMGDRAYTAVWEANSGVTYNVQYYIEKIESTDKNVAGNYTLKEQTELSGTTGEEVTAEQKTYTGFTYDSTVTLNKVTGTVAGNGSLVLKVYYTRNSYTLTMQKDENIDTVAGQTQNETTGNAVDTDTLVGTFKYEEQVTITATPKTEAGYTIAFKEWETECTEILQSDETKKASETSFTMPAEDVTVKATATKEANTVGYTVEYYYEGASGYASTPTYTDTTRTSQVATTVNVTDADKVPSESNPGYVFDEEAGNVLTTSVPATGTAVLKVYFKKVTYTLSIVAGDKITQIKLGEETAGEGETLQGTYAYGDSITIDATAGSQVGYEIEFGKWESSDTTLMADNTTKNLTFTMPNGDLTLTAVANITALNTSYTVEYYYQVNGTYPATPGDGNTVTRTGKTGDQVSITNADKEPITAGYVYDTEASNIESTDENGLKADGSTVLKVYFKQQFTVTFKPGEHGSFENTTVRNNDYDAEIPTFTGTPQGNDGYVFDSWKLTKIGDTEVTEETEIPTTVKANLEYTAQWKTMPQPIVTHTPTTWTNQNVTVTVTSPEGYDVYGKEYRIGDSTEWHTYDVPFEVEQNCTVHARLTLNTNKGEAVDYDIENIDKINPAFSQTPTYTIDNNIATVTANITDSLSGVVEYGFKGESYTEYTTYTCTSTSEIEASFSDIHQTGNYVIYAKDAAGNINTTTIEILIPVHNVAMIVSAPEGYESLVGTKYVSLSEALEASDTAAQAGNVKIEIIDYIDNEDNTIESGRDYTINLNNYFIKNHEAKPVFTVNGKLKILDENVMGTGTVASPYGVGIYIALNGELTIGEDDGTISMFSPIIEGLTYGIKKDIDYDAEKVYDEKDEKYYFPEGVFNFYDGKLIGGTGAFDIQRVNDTPLMYDPSVVVSATTGKSEATLAIGNAQEAVIGKKRFVLLEDAIEAANNTIGDSNTQVEIKIVKDLAKDENHKIVVDETKNIKLDLNGHVFTTTTADYVIKNYGKLEICDSSEKDIIKTVAGESQFSADKSTWNDYKNRAYNITLNSGTGTLSDDGALVFNGSTTYKIQNWDVGSIASYEVEVAIDENFTPRNSSVWYNCSCILGCELSSKQKDFGIIISSDKYYAIGYDSTTVWKSDVKATDGNYHKLRLEYTPNYIAFFIDGVKKKTVDYVPAGNEISELGIGWNCSSTNTAIKGKIKSVKIEKLSSGIVTNSKAGTIYNGVSENSVSNLSYEDIDLSKVVAADANYHFETRGVGTAGLISNNSNTAKTTAKSYIEVDLTNKKGMYEIKMSTITKGSASNSGYIVVSNQTSPPTNPSDSYGRKEIVAGTSAGVQKETKFNLAGGEKYYIHLGYYCYYTSVANSCFIVESMRIAKINTPGELKLTSGTFENLTAGTTTSYVSVVDNDSICNLNGAKLYTTQSYSYGIYNGKSKDVGYTEINSGCIYARSDAICNNNNGLLVVKGGDICGYKYTSNSNYKAINNMGYAYISGDNTIIDGYESIRNSNRAYLCINNGNLVGNTSILNKVSYTDYASIVVNGGNLVPTSYGIYNDSNGNVTFNNGNISSTDISGQPITSYGIYNYNNGGIVFNNGNIFCKNSAIENRQSGITKINGGTLRNNTTSTNAVVRNATASSTCNGELIITGGTITGLSYAVGDYNAGKLTILGGNIEATQGTAVLNDGYGSVTIGTKDGTVDTELPSIKASATAVNGGVGELNFYDGVLIGQLNNTLMGALSDIEEGKELIAETKTDGLQYITLGNQSNYIAKIAGSYSPNVSAINTNYYKLEDNNYYFKTLKSAVEACNTTNATTIELLDNAIVSEQITVNENQNITIEFNGKTMYLYADTNFNNNGKLNFKNQNTTENAYGNIAESAGKLIQNNTNAEASVSKIAISYVGSKGIAENSSNGTYRKIIDNFGKLNISNSTYYANGASEMYADGIRNEANGIIEIDGLSISGNVYYPIVNFASDPSDDVYSVRIKNCTINCARAYGLQNQGTGTIYIEDSSVTTNNESKNSSTGSIIIMNSTFTKNINNASSGYILVDGPNSSLISITNNTSGGRVEIKDGLLKNNGKSISNSGTLIISGGRFENTNTGSSEVINNGSTGSVEISGVNTKIISKYNGIINNGNMVIKDASVRGEVNGITNAGTLTLGQKDSIVKYVPVIYGKRIGIKNTKTVNFYDGIIDGNDTNSINGVVPSETENDCIRVTHSGGTSGAVFDDGTTDKYNIESGREISVLAKVDVAYVASKDRYYTSLAEAFSDTASTDTVELIHDVSISGIASSAEITAGKNITLDLKGFNIVAGNSNTIVNNGTFSIIDSTSHVDATSGETIEGSFIGGASTIIQNNGSCTIQTGTYGLTLGGTSDAYYKLIDNTGTLTLNGGTYYTQAGYSQIINCTSGNVIINAGLYKSNASYSKTIETSGGTITINNATINGYDDVLICSGSGTITVEDGTISGNSFKAVDNTSTGTINIKGGNINGGINNNSTGTINISGGTIVYKSSGEAVRNISSGEINVTGGEITGATVIRNGSTGTVNVDGTQLTADDPIKLISDTSNNTDGYGIVNGGTGVVNIKGHVLINVTRKTRNYGVYSISGGTVNIGDSNEITNNVKIIAREYGIYNFADGFDNVFNYYGGTITANEAVHGYIEHIPDNYEILKTADVNENEIYEIGHTQEVASVEGTTYDTLQEAFENCSNGTVILLKDLVICKGRNLIVNSGKDVILDLNNHTIRIHKTDTLIENNGTFKLNDGSIGGNGLISGSAGTVIDDKGELYILGGTISVNQRNNDKVVCITENGKIEVSGGTLSEVGTNAGKYQYLIYSDNTEEVKITGGKFILYGSNAYSGTGSQNCAIYTSNSNAKVKISGGRFENANSGGDKYSVYMNAGGTCNIFGDTYSENRYGVYITDSGTVNISGDVNLNNTHYAVYANALRKSNVEVSVNINGGTVNGIYCNNFNENSSTCTVNARGGEITGSGIKAYISTYNCTVNLYEGSKVNATDNIAINSIKTVNMYGGEVTGSENGIKVASGTSVNITGGTVTGTTGSGILVTGGTLTLGENDGGYPNQESPAITGNTYGVETTSGTVNFYDGILTGATYATAGTISNKPEMFSIMYSANGTVAKLGIDATVNQVAKVNGVNYNDIGSAISAAININGTVELCKDITISLANAITIPANSHITIDLCGNSIRGYTESESIFINNGTLSIIDSTEDGTNTSTIRNYTGKAIINNGTLTIGTDDGTQYTNAPKIVGTTQAVEDNGTMNIYDGQLETTD